MDAGFYWARRKDGGDLTVVEVSKPFAGLQNISCMGNTFYPYLDEASEHFEILDRIMMSPWRPIDTAPKDGTFIDLWDGEERLANCCWQEDRWLQRCAESSSRFPVGEYCAPTHWAPILPGPNSVNVNTK